MRKIHLDEIPEIHQKALKTFLDFWTEHRDTLLDGELTAENPLQNYSIVSSSKDGEVIAVAHSKPVIEINTLDKLYFFNATDETRLFVYTEQNFGLASATVKDCCGNIISTDKVDLTAGIHYFNVPRSGMLYLSK